MARKKKSETISKIVGREVSLDEFREYISMDMFRKSYQTLEAGVRKAVDTRIKSMTPRLKK